MREVDNLKEAVRNLELNESQLTGSDANEIGRLANRLDLIARAKLDNNQQRRRSL